MKSVISSELKYSICNLRFLAGILLLIIVDLISEGAMLQKLGSSNLSAEGPGWFVAYSYCINSKNMLMFTPIAVILAAGEAAEEELRTRFSMFSCIRAGKKQYLVGKTMGLIISAGMMICIAMMVLLGIGVIGFAHIPAIDPSEFHMWALYSETILSLIRLFFNGAFWGVVGGFASIVTKNRYMAYAVPFVLYYVLTIFQERYYQKLFFLSPRFWATTLYYGNIFCISILIVGTVLISFLFMLAIKRRVENA